MEKTTNQEPMAREEGRKKLEVILRGYFSDQEMSISLACMIDMLGEKMETGDDDKALEKRRDNTEEWESDKKEGSKHIDALLSIMEKWDSFLDRTDKLVEEIRGGMLRELQKNENHQN